MSRPEAPIGDIHPAPLDGERLLAPTRQPMWQAATAMRALAQTGSSSQWRSTAGSWN